MSISRDEQRIHFSCVHLHSFHFCQYKAGSASGKSPFVCACDLVTIDTIHPLLQKISERNTLPNDQTLGVISPHLDMSLDVQNAIMQSQLTHTKSLFFWFKKPSREKFTKQFFVSITFDLVSLWKSYNFANAVLTELIKQIVRP